MAVTGTLESIKAMDNDQQVQVIQAGLDALEGMPVSDDRSAREAFTHVMVTVSRINELSAKARAQAMIGGGAPGDEIAEKLREWLDRLVSALPGIVGRLAGATAFSISVGCRRSRNSPV
jgi:NADH dehydrogenase FAD-containing subunit